MQNITRLVLDSEPPVPKPGLALWRRLILLSGRIPRGAGRAPRPVSPEHEPGPQDLLASLERAGQAVDALLAAPADGWFRHFALGPMDRDTSLRFLAVHNRHHARIAREIVAHAATSRAG